MFWENEHVIALNIIMSRYPKLHFSGVPRIGGRKLEPLTQESFLQSIQEHNEMIEKKPWLGLYSTDMCERI